MPFLTSLKRLSWRLRYNLTGSRFSLKAPFHLSKSWHFFHLWSKLYYNRYFSSISDVHVKTVHDKDKSHLCTHCPKKFGYSRLLRDHIKKAHAEELSESWGWLQALKKVQGVWDCGVWCRRLEPENFRTSLKNLFFIHSATFKFHFQTLQKLSNK